jgi:hypothetical protein
MRGAYVEGAAADIVMILDIGGNKTAGVQVGGARLEDPYLGRRVIRVAAIQRRRNVPARIPVRTVEAFQERRVIQVAAMAHPARVPIPVMEVGLFLGLRVPAQKGHRIIIPARIVGLCLGPPVH